MAKLHSITRHGAHVIKINQAFLLLSRVFGPTPILHKRKAWDRGYSSGSSNALSFGLGAVLLQRSETQWKLVAFVSRSMLDTTSLCSSREGGISMYVGMQEISSYLLGMKFLIETNHKLLIPLLGVKQLDSLPPRVLRFHLRFARFNYSIAHVPGKQLYRCS